MINTNLSNDNKCLYHKKRSTLFLQMKFNKNNIIIAVRVRPLNEKELEYSNYKILLNNNNKEILTYIEIDTLTSSPEGTIYIGDDRNIVVTKYHTKEFEFDFVFDESTTQDEVYTNTTKMLLDNIMHGYNSTVFAYGATGSGKTYTMVGNDDSPGLMIKAIQDLFEKVKEQQMNDKYYTIKLSYIEVFNETLKDLLIDKQTQMLDIRDSPDKGTVIIGATIIEVKDETYAFELLRDGNKRRREKPTEFNKNSSRSHAVLQIYVEVEEKSNHDMNVNELTFGKFIMVDLAGSERVTAMAKRDKDTESGSINKSLLALSKCIASLVSNSKSKHVHIPYRESKLTRILKDSLGGNSRILMIATVSPSLLNKEETLFTLQYANKAKNIKVNLTKNIIEQKPQISKYEEIIKGLNIELSELKKQIKNQGNISLSNVDISCNEDKGEGGLNENSNDEYKQLQDLIRNHFEKEKQIIMEIISKEKEIEKIKHEIVIQNENENDRDEYINDIIKEINNLYVDEQKLVKDRQYLNKIIIENMNTFGKSLYNIYNYYVAYLNYLTSEHRKEMNNSELQRKDETIQLLLNQLSLRDQKIISAGKALERYNGNLNYLNEDFRTYEEVALDPCEFPIIQLPKQNQHIKLTNSNFSNNNQNNKIKLTSTNETNKDNNNKSLNLLKPSVSNKRQYNYELFKLINKSNSTKNGLLNQYTKHKLFLSNNYSNINIKKAFPISLSNPHIIQPYTKKNNMLLNYNNFNINNQYSKNINSHRQFLSNSNCTPKTSFRTEQNNTSMNSSRSVFENEIEKKVKYILSKNIVGRYRRSPYLNMFN